ncbi:MAG: AbrB family transcriptional regulator [Treponema sp.]|jgi:membrane AbrB-like protein|nr:AbrB family transcriptional regulator [Treponema sp.]
MVSASRLFLVNIPLTLLAGGAFGAVFILLKIPKGLRIGAMLGSALLSVFFNAAYMPSPTRLAVQAVAGALIACSMEKSDLKCLPLVVKPTLIMLLSFLVLNIGAGFLIYRISPLDLVTALMCVIPGGVTDAPIIAVDMGADPSKVAVAQLARYILGVGVFPPMIFAWDNMRLAAEIAHNDKHDDKTGSPGQIGRNIRRIKSTVKSPAAFICTVITAFGAGILGDLSNIPAGAFLFAMIAVLFLRLRFDFAYLPPWVKKTALLVSGCYIGSGISMNDVMGFRFLALPVVIILAGYIANCFVTGKILSLSCGYNRKEGMLATTPAGASDIALSSADIGVENTSIIIIQIIRAIVAMALFPQIINLLVLIFG